MNENGEKRKGKKEGKKERKKDIENNTWARVDMEFLFECFNSIAYEWAQRTSGMSSWTREENSISATNHVLFCFEHKKRIPDLQPTMYYFVYHKNTITLYSQDKPILLRNENKWIDNPK